MHHFLNRTARWLEGVSDSLQHLEWSPATILTVLSAWALAVVVARLVFHPLRKVPGPWMASLTTWYEFYYDVILGGVYVKQVLKLHERYGSDVVRIGPNHVHVNDPDFHRVVVRLGSPYLKARFFYAAIGNPESLGTMVDPQLHQVKRSIAGHAFSPKAVALYVPYTLKVARRCMDSMAADARAGDSININLVTQSAMADVVSMVLFGQSLGLTQCRDSQRAVLGSLNHFVNQVHIVKHFPILFSSLRFAPRSLVARISPGYIGLRKTVATYVHRMKQQKTAGPVIADAGFPPLFDYLLTPQPKSNYVVPPADVTIDEASAMMVGGVTTAYPLTMAVYLVLSNRDVFARLRSELDEAAPHIKDESNISHVSQLPYLNAVIKETLRLYTPFPGNLPRVVPPEGVRIGSHFIAGGTYISTSLHAMHHNPKVYPDPFHFKPERWLGERGKALDPYFAPFSRGGQSCIASKLAYYEMYIFLSLLFSRFELDLFETSEATIDWTEHIVAATRKPVRVKIVAERW
ncbi:hypothetical protein Aspvir_000389 [Aspergillus viridinutans]|uniref:Cytochrome P450 n=1 Tax=Aspergillus viridinutans TaxID=75553 RepID=A0A9P3EYK8_ASPVI|nr:uncharacterized protein Aspvir_000389 [Aspergillus viridinutans]GIJ98273.1 hypothetical protein Aspvir_000389 [Aspergillus viridinutans]